MTLDLAFWAPYDAPETQARVDVERQAREWADAEPNVTACRIVASRPAHDHHLIWTVTVELDFIDDHAGNLTLWDAA